jgi:hypothetical protein
MTFFELCSRDDLVGEFSEFPLYLRARQFRNARKQRQLMQIFWLSTVATIVVSNLPGLHQKPVNRRQLIVSAGHVGPNL